MPQSTLFSHLLTRLAAVLVLVGLFSLTSYAQGPFVSGSTGADGPFNPTQNQTVLIPESGVFNFTEVNIPANVTIRFGRNSRNTPVTILATGNVTIAGTIDVSGSSSSGILGGAGGPSGFNGGNGGPAVGGNLTSAGTNGDGPGGGGGAGSSSSSNSAGSGGGGGFGTVGQPGEATASQIGQTLTLVNGAGGPKYGLPTLLPLIGGSGGGGEIGLGSTAGRGGGGGGGAILIASSGTISFTANPSIIFAQGGARNFNFVGSGGGSGGAVRLVANVLTGTLHIDASGGSSHGGGGYIRLEAFDLKGLNLSIGGSPRVSTTTPRAVSPANAPSIRIVSVAGVAAPTNPIGSIQGGPDLILPANQANPVNVALAASNIPLGTTLQITLTPENGARTVAQSTTLTGTLASSTATASITIPNGISVIQASGTIDVATLGMVVNGEQIKSIEVNSVFGGNQTITYITTSNKRIQMDE